MYQHLRLQIVINWFVAIVKKTPCPHTPPKKSFNQLNFKKKIEIEQNQTKQRRKQLIR